jgi:hypothetical protein
MASQARSGSCVVTSDKVQAANFTDVLALRHSGLCTCERLYCDSAPSRRVRPLGVVDMQDTAQFTDLHCLQRASCAQIYRVRHDVIRTAHNVHCTVHGVSHWATRLRPDPFRHCLRPCQLHHKALDTCTLAPIRPAAICSSPCTPDLYDLTTHVSRSSPPTAKMQTCSYTKEQGHQQQTCMRPAQRCARPAPWIHAAPVLYIFTKDDLESACCACHTARTRPTSTWWVTRLMYNTAQLSGSV